MPKKIACPVCGRKKIKLYRNDIVDYEYRVEGSYPLVQCVKCGLIRQEKIPKYSQLLRYYPEDYLVYGQTSKKRLGFFLAFLKKRLYQQRARNYARLINFKGRVLDVGCANCSLLLNFKSIGDFKLYGTDIKDLGVDYKNLGVNFNQGALEKMRMPANFFDLVVLDNLIEHVPDPKLLLEKIYYLLKPGGWVVGTTPNIRSIDAKIFGKYWGGYHLPRHLYFFNQNTIKKLLKNSGFIQIDLPINANPGNWCVSIQNFLRRNKQKMNKYKRTRLFSFLGCVFIPISLLFSILKFHSVMDFIAQKPKG